jgi:hypothetical protein
MIILLFFFSAASADETERPAFSWKELRLAEAIPEPALTPNLVGRNLA